MKRDDVVDFLNELSFNELLKVVYECLQVREEFPDIHPFDDLPEVTKFVLADAWYSGGKVNPVHLLAIGQSVELSDRPGQCGTCGKCSALLASTCKGVICPICGLEGVRLT